MKRHITRLLALLAFSLLSLARPCAAQDGAIIRAPLKPFPNQTIRIDVSPRPDEYRIRTSPTPSCQAPPDHKRPMVVVGGWSNKPEDFLGTTVVNALARRLFVATENAPNPFDISTPNGGGGLTNVLLTRHRDPWGDIDQNANFEAAQIVKFMDALNAEGGCVTDFDLVGFSMGGLVARSLVLKSPGALGRYRVANLVTMGTPNHGVNPIVGGLGVGVSWVNSPQNSLRNSLQRPDGVAVLQMVPFSPFLIDLNARQIPSSIKVTTIAGSALVDTVPQPPHPQGHTTTVACTHIVTQHPDGDQLPETRVACAHMECKRRGAFGACVQLGPQHPDGHTVGGGRVACTHRVQQHPGGDALTTACTHPPASRREGIGSDGLIRVSSVNLRPAEAANIVAQHVLDGLWHTQGNEDAARLGAPAPRPFIDGRNSPPEQALGSGPPITGVAVRSPHFFTDGRVKDILLSIANSR